MAPNTLDIIRLDGRGHGVAHVDGARITVPLALPGERVQVDIAKVRGRLTGMPNEILVKSPDRTDPACPFVESCPGCTLRQVKMTRQQTIRMRRIREGLGAMVQHLPTVHLVGALPRDGIRSRAVAHAMLRADGQLVLGMRGRLEQPIPLSACPVHTPTCRAILQAVEHDLRQIGVQPYDQAERTGVLRHVLVEEFDSHRRTEGVGPQRSQRIVLALGQPADEALFKNVGAAAFPDASLLIEVLPYRGSASIAKPRVLRGNPAIGLPVEDDVLQATLPAWTPQAPRVSAWLRKTIRRWLMPTPDARILEVGCGVGTLTLDLARQGKHVVAIDACRTAIADAKANAMTYGLTNIEFRTGVANKALIRLMNRGDRFHQVVLHAMRRPLGPRTMSVIEALNPSKILYIGPSARSIGEDISRLQHYTCEQIGFVDQTPGTTASLSVVLLHRKPTKDMQESWRSTMKPVKLTMGR
ncbi:MAG: methyltransferase domain-containing protein [Myxococcota bacterium]|nr:methyltransferase domain-containing protein [Myxococcota bacterium]